MKFVSQLSELSQSWLKTIQNASNESKRTRDRARAILLSSGGFTIQEIVIICDATRKTISGWIDAWTLKGFDTLLDAPHPGRPTIIKTHQEEDVIKMVEKNPRQVNAVLDEIYQTLGFSISKKTLKRLLKKKGFHGKELENR